MATAESKVCKHTSIQTVTGVLWVQVVESKKEKTRFVQLVIRGSCQIVVEKPPRNGMFKYDWVERPCSRESPRNSALFAVQVLCQLMALLNCLATLTA